MTTATIEEKLLSKQNSRNIIRAKLVELGLAESSAKLETLASIIDSIINRGAVSVQVKEGETYTIPKGYHDGSGTVSGVSGGGDYRLEPTRSVTPTKQQQNITPSNGFYGLEGVTVGAIPEIYQDVSSVTASAGDVLSGKVIVDATGKVIAGTMADNGAVTKILDATTVSYTIPAGKHSGTGMVSITLETKTVTPAKERQTVTPTAGKVLGEVVVNPIPSEYISTEDADALPGDILTGKSAYAGGVKVDGSMPDNGAVSGSINGITTTSVSIPAGYTSGGSVDFDDTKIAEMLDAILSSEVVL